MLKINFGFLIFITILTTILSIFGIINITKMSDDGVQYLPDKDYAIIKYVPIDSPGYIAGLQIGDTVISINGRTYSSLSYLKGHIIEKIGEGKMAIYKIRRSSVESSIPVIMGSYYPKTTIFFQIIFAFTFIFASLMFYVTFPVQSAQSFLIYLFYQFITIIHLYSHVSFVTNYLYIFLILTASFAPSIIIVFSLSFFDNVKNWIKILTLSASSAIFLIWGFFYLKWSFSLTLPDLRMLMFIVKTTQIVIAIMIFCGAIMIIRSIYLAMKDKEKYYISYISTFILIGYFPFLILFSIPIAFGQKEILSLGVSISFSMIPLFGIIIFNNFLNKLTKRQK